MVRSERFQILRDSCFDLERVSNEKETLLVAHVTSIAKWPDEIFLLIRLNFEYVFSIT